MPDLLRALRIRNFRVFFIGQSFSLVGTWMQQIAAAWLVYRLSGSPLMLGVAAFAGQIPILLLAPFGGLVADRFERRRALIVSQSFACLQALALAALVFSGRAEVWHVIAAAAVLGMINAIDAPIRQAFLLEMVESRDLLPNAIALNSFMMNGSRLIGPPLAGLLVVALGEAWCFLINGVSYAAVLLALSAMRIAPRPRTARPSRWHEELLEAFRFVRHYVPARILLSLVALVGLLAVPYSSLLPIFARDRLGGDALTLGWLSGAGSLGAVAGIVWLAGWRGIRHLERLATVACATAGLGILVFSASTRLPLSLTVMPLIGFGILLTTASVNTILQTVVPDHLRGRIVSLHVTAFLGMAPIGHFLLGLAAERVGAPLALGTAGAGCLAAALWVYRQLPAVRRVLEEHVAQA